jgi:sphingomyelin phosphodiesterase
MASGYWGSLAKCDLPMQTFDLFLSELKTINPDFIIWTGDNTAHDIWAQSQSYNINFTTVLTQKIKSVTNATVIPSMGNHESYPVNVYDYTNNREDMLKQALA